MLYLYEIIFNYIYNTNIMITFWHISESVIKKYIDDQKKH